MSRLKAGSESGEAVRVVDQFQYAMFWFLVLMCFGDKLEEKKIHEIETVQRRRLLSLPRFNLLYLWPKAGKVFLKSVSGLYVVVCGYFAGSAAAGRKQEAKQKRDCEFVLRVSACWD